MLFKKTIEHTGALISFFFQISKKFSIIFNITFYLSMCDSLLSDVSWEDI